jgi:hypothetical protein
MKIFEFIETYKKMQTKSVASVSKMIEAKQYIPVLRKKYLAELVYNASTEFENNIVKVDSLSKYMIFTMLMISEYTNLEFSVDEKGAATEAAIEEYDALCSNDCINPILECFANDYVRANEILNYVFQDNLAAANSIEAVVGRSAEYLLGIVEALSGVLANTVNQFDLSVPDMDSETISKVMNILKGTEE